MTKIYLHDPSNVNWPGCLPWRDKDSKRGYSSIKDAEKRLHQINEHYNAKHGQGVPLVVMVDDHNPLYMNISTGSTGHYDDWYYDTEDGETVNAVDKGEVVQVYWNENTENWEEI